MSKMGRNPFERKPAPPKQPAPTIEREASVPQQPAPVTNWILADAYAGAYVLALKAYLLLA